MSCNFFFCSTKWFVTSKGYSSRQRFWTLPFWAVKSGWCVFSLFFFILSMLLAPNSIGWRCGRKFLKDMEKEMTSILCYLIIQHKANITLCIQMATSENYVNAPSSVCSLLLMLQVIDMVGLWQTTWSCTSLIGDLHVGVWSSWFLGSHNSSFSVILGVNIVEIWILLLRKDCRCPACFSHLSKYCSSFLFSEISRVWQTYRFKGNEHPVMLTE